jgi:hypothetical protein
MKILCKINNVNQIENALVKRRIEKYKDEDNGEIYLTLGKTYNVYGIVFSNNFPFYLICEEDNDDYVIPFDTSFFDVVDQRFSSYWRLSVVQHNEQECSTSIVFKEWADDPLFFEKLLDGEPEEVAIFLQYKKLMDEEFLNENEIQKEIEIGKIGKIVNGEYRGNFLLISVELKISTGFFLKVFSNEKFINSPLYEDWFETYLDLECYFKKQGWKVKWTEKVLD